MLNIQEPLAQDILANLDELELELSELEQEKADLLIEFNAIMDELDDADMDAEDVLNDAT